MNSLCENCRRETIQNVLFEKIDEKVIRDVDGSVDYWYENKYQIIQCGGCAKISFRILHNDMEQQEYAYYADEDPWTQELFPKRTVDLLPVKDLDNTPKSIVKLYRETIDAFNNDQPILCSAGIRGIIEGICNQKGILGGHITDPNGDVKFTESLNGKITGLASKKILSRHNAKILMDLTFLGNEAIHALSSPTNSELKHAINILEHSLENIYELEYKAELLKAETARRKKQIR